jgi:FkbM family methyltransferase
MHRSAYLHMTKCVEEYLSPDRDYRVLDFGSRVVANQKFKYKDLFKSPNFSYVGVDIAEGENVDVVMQEPYKLPFDDNSFDLIVSGQVFEHVPFFWVSFLEMTRVLSAGGMIFLTAPSRGHIHNPPFDCWRFYPDSYKALAAFSGVKLISVNSDFPTRKLPNGRFDYTAVPDDQYWGDTVGVFLKEKNNEAVELRELRDRLVNWSNERSDIRLAYEHAATLQNDGGYIRHGKYPIRFKTVEGIFTEKVTSTIKAGHYEAREARAILKFVGRNERVLELGAGLGFVSTLIGKELKPDCYLAIEADPRLVPVIRETHRINGVSGVMIQNCIATSDKVAIKNGTAPMRVAENFWGSSIKRVSKEAELISVDVVALQTFVDAIKPTVLIADIEGGETDLFQGLQMNSIRVVIIELHPLIIGDKGVERIFQQLSDAGFSIAEYDAKNQVAVLQREMEILST